MSKHDEDAVVELSLSETEARLLRAYFEASRGYAVSDQIWERMKGDYTDPMSMAGDRRRGDMRRIMATLSALKPGDRLPGGLVVERTRKVKRVKITAGMRFANGLVAVPSEPTEAMVEAGLEADGLLDYCTDVKSVYRAMLSAASTSPSGGGRE